MGKTLSHIQSILNNYVSQLKSIDVETDEEFYAAIDTAKKNMLKSIEQLRNQIPESLFLNYSKKLSVKDAENIVSKIKDNAANRYVLDTIPSTEYFVDTIQGDSIITPSFVGLDSYNEFCVSQPNGQETIVQFLLSMMLALPIKKVKFTFVDLSSSYLTDFFYKNIDSSLYHDKPISDADTLKQYLISMNERVLRCVRDYGDIIEYNTKHRTVIEPYEIIVLLDDYCGYKGDYDLQQCQKELDKLKKNGAKAGIHIVNFKQTSKVYPKKALVNISPIVSIPNLQKAIVQYINEEAKKNDETRIITFDLQNTLQKSFEPLTDSLSIPIGKNGNNEVLFKMDIVSHVHAFVLGQSGSGKSVLLHDIISGSMLKYSPDDLELYLLDFKLGGVEFNRYKSEKHVHAMLVDNSDPQITLEILRELRDRMSERGKILRKAGLNNINEYNAQHPENKMKHILFVADECHEMFRMDDNNRAIGNEISEIIVKIAKEGRNQGVHLLLATQTIANTEISTEILNNISDHYLLKCAIADSEKMVTKSSDITGNLTIGNVYYHHVDGSFIFQAFYADKKQSEEIMQIVNKKTESFDTNETFYFNGASIFKFDKSVVKNHSRKCRKMPVAFIGKSIDIKQDDVVIPLSEDFSENILLLGLNDEYQSTRTSMNLLISLLASCKSREVDVDFKVIDCLNDDKYAELLDDLTDAGLVDVIAPKKRASFFKQLAEDILSAQAKETILFILGQDRFRELKLDMEFDMSNANNDDSELTNIISLGSGSSNNKLSIKSFSEALNVILDKGPEVGVHTIIQLEKAANYLFSDYITHKELFQKFKHLILLKSDENAANQLHLRNDIRLENLSKDEERLRAYYYAEESDTYTLFTPYMPLEGKELKQFIKTL